MDETITLTLNSPITEEQWDVITDVDFDSTDRIWFHTKHGKEVEFVKVIRCKDCKHFELNHIGKVNGISLIVAHKICKRWGNGCRTSENGWCFLAERKEE